VPQLVDGSAAVVRRCQTERVEDLERVPIVQVEATVGAILTGDVGGQCGRLVLQVHEQIFERSARGDATAAGGDHHRAVAGQVPAGCFADVAGVRRFTSIRHVMPRPSIDFASRIISDLPSRIRRVAPGTGLRFERDSRGSGCSC
jgi:hypothetical protein